MMNYRIDKRVHYIGGSVQSTARLWPVAATSNWWEAGGATGCIAAYQPKGAASYAASLTDLSGTGNNATEGTAPTWATETGWTFNGTTQYLSSGITPGATYTTLARLSNGTGNGQLFGNRRTGTTNGYHIHPTYSGTTIYFRNAGNYNQAGAVASGVVGIAGKSAIIDGSTVGTINAAYALVDAVLIVAGSYDTNYSAVNSFMNCKIQAFAIYDNTLDTTAIAAVCAAMAAL